eukprot:TRINITY_DN85846_c0_g1_i1.p2 TRINITY_DN85846_c0_g1~~TRINITY_DN85846_c0_g1_i1.p2  ORF type:complete len:116 (-),score=8.77 TRINITY_DN85846_c0_g1_i1:12-323(-)
MKESKAEYKTECKEENKDVYKKENMTKRKLKGQTNKRQSKCIRVQRIKGKITKVKQIAPIVIEKRICEACSTFTSLNKKVKPENLQRDTNQARIEKNLNRHKL